MRIGELASRMGVSAKAIRFYESIGLLAEPDRTSAGYRQYTPADADQLGFIKTAQRLGMRLDEIREILAFRDHGRPRCGHVRQGLHDRASAVAQRIAELTWIRQELATLDTRTQRLARGGHECGIPGHATGAPQPGTAGPAGR